MRYDYFVVVQVIRHKNGEIEIRLDRCFDSYTKATDYIYYVWQSNLRLPEELQSKLLKNSEDAITYQQNVAGEDVVITLYVDGVKYDNKSYWDAY